MRHHRRSWPGFWNFVRRCLPTAATPARTPSILAVVQKKDRPNHPQTQGKVEHLNVGIRHARTRIRMLVHDRNVIVIDRDTGEILRELTIDPAPATAPAACPGATRSPRKKMSRDTR